MNDFLESMTQSSRERMAHAIACESHAAIRARALAAPAAPRLRPERSFRVIAEFKPCSPARGNLARDRSLAGQVMAYARAGASAVSVLTEPTRFGGSLVHLAEAASLLAPLGVPVLRKDFLIDAYQLFEARAAGAGGVLLIARMLPDAVLAEMLDRARELGLFVLLEAFDAGDVRRAVAASGPRQSEDAPVLFGVNCRDLRTLGIQPRRFHELAQLLPDGLTRVAESGIATPDACAEAVRAGYDAVLVGEALMAAADPEALIRAMLAAGHAAARAAA